MASDTTRGLYGKFLVQRRDGSSAHGERHENCDYFVLDMNHDPHAKPAVAAYADSVEPSHSLLAIDLRMRYGVQPGFNFEAHLQRQLEFSEKTYGPGICTEAVLDHIRKELVEIEEAPTDIEEWIDVVILALDGAWRAGATPAQIIEMLKYKQAKNESRKWPDWRTVDRNVAITHIKDPE